MYAPSWTVFILSLILYASGDQQTLEPWELEAFDQDEAVCDVFLSRSAGLQFMAVKRALEVWYNTGCPNDQSSINSGRGQSLPLGSASEYLAAVYPLDDGGYISTFPRFPKSSRTALESLPCLDTWDICTLRIPEADLYESELEDFEDDFQSDPPDPFTAWGMTSEGSTTYGWMAAQEVARNTSSEMQKTGSSVFDVGGLIGPI
jgi:hypothetical protein